MIIAPPRGSDQCMRKLNLPPYHKILERKTGIERKPGLCTIGKNGKE